MTEPRDWLEEALDRQEGEVVPSGFMIRLERRIVHERRRPGPRMLRWSGLAAAGLAILATGYWLGMGAPRIGSPPAIGADGELATLEVADIYVHRDLLESWDLLQDPEVAVGLSEPLTEAFLWQLQGGDAEAADPTR